ncbi:MAG: S8 family serine peptidase [Rubricoccaceae bacterium]|nr:S8 family serine peptidase [Rubricoccaceae bacterium]
MICRSFYLLLTALLASPYAYAQNGDAPPQVWYNLDYETDGVYGMSIDRAYEALEGRTPTRQVVVAVIDSGVDITHEDLQGQIWTNGDELAGNSVDDDGNGYVDDVSGWNFIGGPDGQNVSSDSFELARQVSRLRAQFRGVDTTALSGPAADDYAHWQELEAELADERAEFEGIAGQMAGIQMAVHQAHSVLSDHFEREDYAIADVDAIRSTDQDVLQARDILLFLDANGLTVSDLDKQVEYVTTRLEFGLNPDFDPRNIVGDDFSDVNERFYGNADVSGPDPGHGTAVAGVIAAVRGNGIGIDGVAPNVRIMPVRTVPNGDERDKDVANAIRYAVDNGADIINMSFGKGISPRKDAVDVAVRYAVERGVLLIHAAGNDGSDLNIKPNFPTRRLDDGTEAANWLEVGASRWDDALVASFSNYGAEKVDVFAPGASIYSLEPGNSYGSHDGTSLAAPLVSGVAAMLMAYFPELEAPQVRQILLDSATRFTLDVQVPGDDTVNTSFASLSITGAVINAYNAVEMAGRQPD